MTRNKLADMATDIEASRLLTYHGASADRQRVRTPQ
jgi:alkylation response protein AidB-like acyl-CoA dehydrogenase